MKDLRSACCEANRRLHATGIVDLTFGNVSVVDRGRGVLAIKPSGVDYEELVPDSIVVLSLADGKRVEGDLNPSTDTPTHRRLYQLLPEAGCIVHTHSRCATAFAQAGISIPCLGTTHADFFRSEVPVTREMNSQEIAQDYEWNQAEVIAELGDSGGALLRGHGVFVWDTTWERAVEKAFALEIIAEIAIKTLLLSPGVSPLSQALLDKHFDRKHGETAYYGQKRD